MPPVPRRTKLALYLFPLTSLTKLNLMTQDSPAQIRAICLWVGGGIHILFNKVKLNNLKINILYLSLPLLGLRRELTPVRARASQASYTAMNRQTISRYSAFKRPGPPPQLARPGGLPASGAQRAANTGLRTPGAGDGLPLRPTGDHKRPNTTDNHNRFPLWPSSRSGMVGCEHSTEC